MKRLTQLLLPMLALALVITLVWAQGSDYQVTRWSVNSSGTLCGGEYTLHGIAGQSEAGVSLSGGSYDVIGGFVVESNMLNPSNCLSATDNTIYLPLILRNS